jgi:hypothetical protein
MLGRSCWLLMAVAVISVPSSAQDVLAPIRASGQTVTPVFEGWYRNADGTYSISFGYFNRNASEILEIPIGTHNNISPGDANQGQPTSFQPRRHWGVFAVRVPADFGERKVTWTLVVRGETLSVAGSLRPQWQIDAVEGEAGSGNTPPALKFEKQGTQGRGPGGIVGSPMQAVAGRPLTLTVWTSDDGSAWRSISSDGRAGTPVTLTWFKHQGTGAVAFTEKSPKVDPSGVATTTATFSAAGEYMLRVRANDASGVDDAGHAQCCWTNGFVRVTVRNP